MWKAEEEEKEEEAGRGAGKKEKEEKVKYCVYCDLGTSLNAVHTLPHLIHIIPLWVGPIIIFIF